MRVEAGVMRAAVCAVAIVAVSVPASAQELSDKAVRSFMDYAWSLTPQQFSKPDGTTIVIDKKKKDDVIVPIDVARDVIKAGRLSAHAQVCDLVDDQISNHRSLMRREDARKKWTQQQMVYISQLHLTTVMLLTGKIKLVEKDGDKEVVVDEGKSPPAQTCTEEQKKKVKELITAYVQSGPLPKPSSAAAAAAAAAANASASNGSTGSTAPGPSLPKK